MSVVLVQWFTPPDRTKYSITQESKNPSSAHLLVDAELIACQIIAGADVKLSIVFLSTAWGEFLFFGIISYICTIQYSAEYQVSKLLVFLLRWEKLDQSGLTQKVS